MVAVTVVVSMLLIKLAINWRSFLPKLLVIWGTPETVSCLEDSTKSATSMSRPCRGSSTIGKLQLANSPTNDFQIKIFKTRGPTIEISFLRFVLVRTFGVIIFGGNHVNETPLTAASGRAGEHCSGVACDDGEGTDRRYGGGERSRCYFQWGQQAVDRIKSTEEPPWWRVLFVVVIAHVGPILSVTTILSTSYNTIYLDQDSLPRPLLGSSSKEIQTVRTKDCTPSHSHYLRKGTGTGSVRRGIASSSGHVAAKWWRRNRTGGRWPTSFFWCFGIFGLWWFVVNVASTKLIDWQCLVNGVGFYTGTHRVTSVNKPSGSVGSKPAKIVVLSKTGDGWHGRGWRNLQE